MTSTRLILIRHGESRAQDEDFISGHDTCSGLSDLGRRQAEALRDRLAATGELGRVDALLTSILPRSIETAEVLRPALGNPEPVADCGWCEAHPGEAEGMAWSDLVTRFPPDGDPYHPFRRRLPGMETWAEFYVRVGSRLAQATAEHAGGCIVVAGHGGTVGASFVALGELPIRRGADIIKTTVNTSLTEWRTDNGDDWQLVRFNDTAHLAGLT